MPITLKLGQLVSAKPALERLLQQKFPITTSYKLARRLKIINDVLTTYDAKRMELVKESGTSVPGQPDKIQIRQVPQAEFQAAQGEVLKWQVNADLAKLVPAGAQVTDQKAIELENPSERLAEAETVLAGLLKEQAAWTSFVATTNELMQIDEILNIDLIRLAELQPSSDSICSKCGHAPNEISVEDMLLLSPLLADED